VSSRIYYAESSGSQNAYILLLDIDSKDMLPVMQNPLDCQDTAVWVPARSHAEDFVPLDAVGYFSGKSPYGLQDKVLLARSRERRMRRMK